MEGCENVEGVAPVCHQVTSVEHDRVTVELSQHRRVKALGLCKAALIRLINKPTKNHRPTFDHHLSSDRHVLPVTMRPLLSGITTRARLAEEQLLKRGCLCWSRRSVNICLE